MPPRMRLGGTVAHKPGKHHYARRDGQHAIVAHDRERLVLRTEQAAGDTRSHAVAVLDAAYGKVGSHSIDRNSLVGMQAGANAVT